MKSSSKFIKWAKRESYHKGFVCHFYISDSNQRKQKQYYGKYDYAIFNLFSDSANWMVKGTVDHGILSLRGKRSQVPCLNCFALNKEFYDSLRRLGKEGNKKFELGLILNARKLRNYFKVIPVSAEWWKVDYIPVDKCHHFDNVRYRKPLSPFNYCDVIRIEVPKSLHFGVPMASIPSECIVGVLVRRGRYSDTRKCLDMKGMGNIEVFPLL